MSKFLYISLGLAFFVASNTAGAGHHALEALLANGPLRLKNEPLCEPYQLATEPSKDSQTLAQDVAWVLSDMSEKLINSEASCDNGHQGKKMCKVIFSIGAGELEWARVYQFESVAGKKASTTLKGLRCFNLP